MLQRYSDFISCDTLMKLLFSSFSISIIFFGLFLSNNVVNIRKIDLSENLCCRSSPVLLCLII